MPNTTNDWWELPLDCKPDFDMAMKRIYTWYAGEIIDRAPIRFTDYRFSICEQFADRKWNSIKEKWFDVEFNVENFINSLASKSFPAESFPIFWSNLGPDVFAAFYGAKLEFMPTTSWSVPCIHEWDDINKLSLDWNNEYLKKIEEYTRYALERCEGKFMVGYTDLHPGVDCVAAWRDSQELCLDLYDNPDEVKSAIDKAIDDFQAVYDHFDDMLKSKKQLSANWMEIPSFGKMHVPSCDFSAMISQEQFIEFCLPVIQKEVKPMTHNIWHLDGKDCIRHLDVLLEIPEIQAIQWVQGDGDSPIMQWIPLIKKIQAAGKSVVVSLDKSELEDFTSAVKPKGIMLCVHSEGKEEQLQILKRIEKWV